MHAAVVESFERPPRFTQFPEPAAGPGETVVTVRAAALSQLVRTQAAGTHYSSTTPPWVPGVDGVGVDGDGRRVYFAFPRRPFGAMGERSVVSVAQTTRVPDGLDDVTAAAIGNPGMSSMLALTRRARFAPGESVLVVGATGASGRLAIQIARHLGARRVVAASRQASSEPLLRSLGADAFVPLALPAADLTARFRHEIATGLDVVLDYVWGPVMEAFFAAAAGSGTGQAAPPLRVVNIGALGGPTLTLPAGAMRSSGVELLGSGIGSASHAEILSATGQMFDAIAPAGLRIDTETAPLAQVESAWSRQSPGRMVFTLP